MDTKKEVTRILNKAIADFNSKWCGHAEKENGISNYADEIVKILDQAPVRSSHLRYDLMEAGFKCNESRHAQVVMKELGITYQHSTPQSMGDQWWFWNCENIPENLPSYLTPLELDPMECIGYGLSKEVAEKIRDYDQKRSLRQTLPHIAI